MALAISTSLVHGRLIWAITLRISCLIVMADLHDTADSPGLRSTPYNAREAGLSLTFSFDNNMTLVNSPLTISETC